jgi:hypothetical protein
LFAVIKSHVLAALQQRPSAASYLNAHLHAPELPVEAIEAMREADQAMQRYNQDYGIVAAETTSDQLKQTTIKLAFATLHDPQRIYAMINSLKCVFCCMLSTS